jgi:exonuclease VII large subunit
LVRLAGEIARQLADIGRVAVEGEVYRPQTYRAGRTYFTLRDRAAQMPVSFPARAARRCRAVDGERVLVVGTLVWGNDRGQLILEAEEVVPRPGPGSRLRVSSTGPVAGCRACPG